MSYRRKPINFPDKSTPQSGLAPNKCCQKAKMEPIVVCRGDNYGRPIPSTSNQVSTNGNFGRRSQKKRKRSMKPPPKERVYTSWQGICLQSPVAASNSKQQFCPLLGEYRENAAHVLV